MKNNTILSIVLVTLLMISGSVIGQTVATETSISEEQKPEVIVVSANYGLLVGYSFFIEHRGAKRTGNKETYRFFQRELSVMGNPSDAANFMNNSGYDLQEVYSFPKDTETTTINYVYKKR